MGINSRVASPTSEPINSECSSELVKEKLRALKTKVQTIKAEAKSDSTVMKKMQELKKDQEDMKEKIEMDSQQVRLLEKLSHQVFERLEKYLNIRRPSYPVEHESGRREVSSMKEENVLEFNFNYDATFRGYTSGWRSLQKDGYDKMQHGFHFREHLQMSKKEIEIDGNEIEQSCPAPDIGDWNGDAGKYLEERKDEDGQKMFIELVRKGRRNELREVCTVVWP